MDDGNGRGVAKEPDLLPGMWLWSSRGSWWFLSPSSCLLHIQVFSTTCLQRVPSVSSKGPPEPGICCPGEGAGGCCCCKGRVTHALQLAPDRWAWLAWAGIPQRGHCWGAEALKGVLPSEGSVWWEGKGRSAAVGDDLCCDSVGVVGFNACQGHFDLWMESFGVNLCLFSSLFSP